MCECIIQLNFLTAFLSVLTFVDFFTFFAFSSRYLLGHPHKMFRFQSPHLLWWWVSGSGKKNEWTLEGVWVPEISSASFVKLIEPYDSMVLFGMLKCVSLRYACTNKGTFILANIVYGTLGECWLLIYYYRLQCFII